MPNSRAARRRQWPLGDARPRPRSTDSRRLGIEIMERRLMLSAMPLEPAPIDLVADIVRLPDLEAPFSLPLEIKLAPGDGGFIPLDRLSTAESFGVPRSTGAIFTTDSPTVTSNGIPDSWLDLSKVHFSGVTPVKIALEFRDVSQTPDGRPSRLVDSDRPTDDAQGGSIPIESLLSGGSRRDDAMFRDTGNRAATHNRAGAALSPAPGPAASLVASQRPTTALSGEWARPVVFEMAGGEPAHGGQSAAIQDAVAPKETGSRTPNVERQSTSGANQGDASAAKDTPLDAAAATDISDEPRAASAVAEPNPASSALTPPVVERASVEADGQPARDDRGAARQEAFAQLDESGEMLVPASRDDESWHGGMEATGLLLALAMERIVARGVRKSSGNEAAFCEQPRRRLPST